MPRGKVIIAGAGPGDPELLTLKTLRAIEKADVILYDALVNPAILHYAKKGCEFIFVGKRRGHHEFSQQSINDLLLKYSSTHACVLRLKGGDPYIFGRGFEEYFHLINNGVTAEVIPGISSALSAATAVGIPVTLRGVSESVWIITGTVRDGGLSRDLSLAARSTATIVILMGMSQLDKIAQHICKLRGSHEPIAIIQHATTPRQRAVHGTALNIVQVASQYSVEAPAVIVVGNVVNAAQVEEFLNMQEVKLRLAV